MTEQLTLKMPTGKASKPTQADRVLDHLQHVGPITAIDALDRFGCFRLAARINELKGRGYDIRSEPYRTRRGATIARYSLR